MTDDLRLQPREVVIRALGISLVAIAAIVATMTVARQRSEEKSQEFGSKPGGAPPATRVDLDALRSAGM